MDMAGTTKYVAGAAFIGAIVTANYLTDHYGMVDVGFGLTATAGTYAAGAALLLRDYTQERSGRVANSADGTFLKFGPDINIHRLREWLRELNHRPVLDLNG